MSAGKRALLLILPLIAFAIGGGFYVPVPNSDFDTNGSMALASKDLPRLPDWAREPLPDFSQIRDTTEKKAAFFSFLYPRIVLANSRVLIERNYMMQLRQKSSLTAREKKWLQGQADRLKIDAAPGSDEQWQLLEKRLDVIPPSLIMAQAANESAWGTSRFARKGNNLFGQWCFSTGCGLVPKHRVEGANHEVARFSSPYGSIRAYIQNLNRHATYQSLREIRIQDREQQRPLSGIEMAQGLLGYSERGKEYVKEIRGMIHYNNLEFYDDDFRATVKDHNLATLQQLVSTRSEDRLLPGNTALSDNAEG